MEACEEGYEMQSYDDIQSHSEKLPSAISFAEASCSAQNYARKLCGASKPVWARDLKWIAF